MQLGTHSLLLASSALAGVSAKATCGKPVAQPVAQTVVKPLASYSNQSVETIEVDVAIIGGGATGAYSAVRLRDDYQKKVIVIEKQDRLVSVILSYFRFPL